MIPKIIHYCWFGNSPIPIRHRRYIQEWKKIMPNYCFILWNEENSPLHSPYLQNALKNKKWANLSNYIRLYALLEYGGLYLDTDIEILKPFDDLLENDSCFLGFEDPFIDWAGCINNAVFGSTKGHWFTKLILENLKEYFDGKEEAHLSSPNLTTALLKKLGLEEYKEQYIKDIHIYPTEYFYPYSWHQVFKTTYLTDKTYCIHRFEQSWKNQDKKLDVRKYFISQYYGIFWKIKKRMMRK